jgi:hypothetical protein
VKSTSLDAIRRLFPGARRAPDPRCPDCRGTGFHREWGRHTSQPCTCIFTTDELHRELTSDVGAHGCAPDRRTR